MSLALDRSSAERPSTSRRLTSLPSVAPLTRPRLSTARTTSGSGLFQRETGCRPTEAPQPTEDSACALEKTSASGPMPTSRYCDQTPFLDQRRLDLRRLARARLQVAQAVADDRADALADLQRQRRVPGRLLLDDALDHRAREGDAAGLDCLQVARREQVRRRAAGFRLDGLRRDLGERADVLSPGGPRTAATGSSSSRRSRIVGKSRQVTSTTLPSRSATTEGP